MTKLIKTLLVEDDPVECERYQHAADRHPDLIISYVSGSEQEALSYFWHNNVDAIVLDIELEEGDGVSFLNALMADLKTWKKEKPFITVVTNSCSNVMLRYMRAHGADYIYQKNNLSYTAERVLAIVGKIVPFQMKMKEKAEMVEKHEDEWEETVKRSYVEDELCKLGMKRALTGYPYIVDATMILMDYSGVPPRLTSDIYPYIAKKYGVTAKSVERAIRSALEVTFREMDAATLHYYYPKELDPALGRPSNSDFLLQFAKKLRL